MPFVGFGPAATLDRKLMEALPDCTAFSWGGSTCAWPRNAAPAWSTTLRSKVSPSRLFWRKLFIGCDLSGTRFRQRPWRESNPLTAGLVGPHPVVACGGTGTRRRFIAASPAGLSAEEPIDR